MNDYLSAPFATDASIDRRMRRVVTVWSGGLFVTMMLNTLVYGLSFSPWLDEKRAMASLITTIIAAAALIYARKGSVTAALNFILVSFFVALIQWQAFVGIGLRGVANSVVIVLIPLASLVGGIKASKMTLAASIAFLAGVWMAEEFGFIPGATGTNLAGLPSVFLYYACMCVISYGVTRNYVDSVSFAFEKMMTDQQLRHDAELANVEQKTVIEYKDAFIGLLSHELRTPLGGIISGANLLSHPKANEAIKSRSVTTLQKSAASMLELLNNLMDSQKLQAGKLVLAQRDFQVGEFFEEICVAFEFSAGEKNIMLFNHVSPEFAQLTLNGDPVRLRQMVANLVSNAIKFTDAGFVRISAHIEETDASENAESGAAEVLVKFVVQDTGKGISADSQKKLFKAYSQLQMESQRGVGSGLGLSLVKNFAEMMGGNVGIVSEEGQGSTFWFTARLRKLGA